MRCGYLPFKETIKVDSLHSLLDSKNKEKFWQFHQTKIAANKSSGALSETFKDLIENLLMERSDSFTTLKQIKSHVWFRGLKKPCFEVKCYLEDIHKMIKDDSVQEIIKQEEENETQMLHSSNFVQSSNHTFKKLKDTYSKLVFSH